MNKPYKHLILQLSVILMIFAGCNNQDKNIGEISRGIPPLKEVETYQIGKDQPELAFSKTGIVESSIIANVSPQIGGKITSIKVIIGQKVEKGQILLTLEDTLQIDLTNLQYQTGAKSLELAEKSQILTQELGEGTYYTAQIGVKNAAETYKKALQSKETAKDLFENQQDLTDLALDTAEEAFKTAKSAYNNLSDSLDELEDQYSELKSNPDADGKTLSEFKKGIDQMESQLVNAKFAKESAENALEQAELGVTQAEETFESQLDQLDFAIESAYLGYQSAVIQARNIPKSSKLQELGIEQQALQIYSGLESTALTLDQTQVISPIEGVVTQINGKENNLVNPGQPVVTIENINALSIKTGISKEELSLLTPQTEISIQNGDAKIPAQIISISPTLDPNSKKIEIEIIPKLSPPKLLPGSLVKVNFSTQASNKIFVPLNSIALDEGKKLVRTLDDNNRVHLSEVELGQIIGDFVEVTKGLAYNEIIIKSAYPAVEEGQRVITND